MKPSSFNIIRSVPIIKVLIPFIVGILFSVFIPFQGSIYILLGIFIIIMVLTVSFIPLLKNYGLRKVFGIGVNITIATAAYLLLYAMPYGSSKYFGNSNKLYCRAVVLETPQIKKNGIRILAMVKEVSECGDTFESCSRRVLIHTSLQHGQPMLFSGDEITLSGYANVIKNNGNPHEFNMMRYWAARNVFYSFRVKQINSCTERKYFVLQAKASEYRERLTKRFLQSGLSGREFPIVSAMVFGARSEIDGELKSAFSSTGVTHVLAVSGMHVAVLFLIINSLLFFLQNYGWQQILKVIFILIILYIYAFVTGLSASVLRAVVMFTFILLARLLHRELTIYHSLAASAFFLLVLNPWYLFDIGFQLSYLAVISIVSIEPFIADKIGSKNRILNYLSSLVSVSIAAQIGVAPLILYYFHSFPLYFIFANLIVIPISFVVMMGGLLIQLLPVAIAAKFITPLLAWVTRLMINSVLWIDGWPMSLIKNISMNYFEMIILYIFLISLIFILVKRSKIGWFVANISFLLLLLSVFINRLYAHNSERILFLNIPGTTVFEIKKSGKNYLIYNSHQTNRSYLHFILSSHWIQDRCMPDTFICLSKTNFFAENGIELISLFDNSKTLSVSSIKFLILGDEKFNRDSVYFGGYDYLVLFGKKKIIYNIVNPCNIILMPSLPYYIKQDHVHYFKLKGKICEDIPNEGCKIMPIK